MNSIVDINPRILSSRLREMEKNNLIKRVIYDDFPVRVEYHLTDKGQKAQSILEQMSAFSLRYCSDEIFKDRKPRTLRQVFGITPSIIK
ncbi:MAG: transcriptional regulator [Nitrosopumilaceae archaeon]|nr:transcriptional regulator [Nitrosopumilaceae archaeon]